MRVGEPLRWLSGKSSTLEDWSLVNSNKLLGITYDLMVAVAVDGSVLLDSTLDPFTAVAASQPKFSGTSPRDAPREPLRRDLSARPPRRERVGGRNVVGTLRARGFLLRGKQDRIQWSIRPLSEGRLRR